LIGHFNADELASYRAGAVRQGRAARIRVHLAACARCAQIEVGLADVSRLLAGIPAPPMPDQLAERVEAAIAAEAAHRAAGTEVTARGYTDPASGTAPARIPGRPDLPERSRRPRRRWRMPDMSSRLLLRGLAASAAVVLIVGGGLLLANAGRKPQNPTSGRAAVAPHVHGATPLGFTSVRYSNGGRYVYTDAMTSNTDYTDDAKLEHGIRGAIKTSPSFGGSTNSTPMPDVGTARTSNATSGTKASVAFPLSQLAACLTAVTSGKTVDFTQLARYLGRPVAIIVFEPAGAVFDVMVVGTACGSTDQDIIKRLTIPRF
jgi:hypothetical protein